MSRQRKPKHPGGRPAQFGARPNVIPVRVDDRMRDELEAHAEAAGLPLALYCMLRLAEMHDLALVQQVPKQQQELPLGEALTAMRSIPRRIDPSVHPGSWFMT